MYQDIGWLYVEHHIHYNLGMLCFKLNHFVAAIHFFLQLLKCEHGNATRQNNFLTKFKTIVRVSII